jgi:hypothetical protein
MTSKEINRLIDKLAYGEDETKRFDVRFEFRVIGEGLSLDQATDIVSNAPDTYKHLYSITSTQSPKYTEDLNLSLAAAKRISEKNNYTFVLSIEDNTWVSCYGDFSDFASSKGQNPSIAICESILKFYGKL